MSDPPRVIMRVLAILMILLNVDVVLSLLLTDGYQLATALTAAGTLGAVTAEIVVRLLPGDDPTPPPALPR